MYEEYIYIYIHIYIYILNWVGPRRDLILNLFIYSFCPYIRVCSSLLLSSENIYGTMRLELTHVCSLNDFQLK